jgi:CheY-like chemotaxis protein
MSPHSKILLVEADPVGRANLAVVLGRLGYSVRCAASCAEALDDLRTHRPNLILLDLRTAELDGGTFYRRYDQNADLAEVPLVVLASPGLEDDLPGDVTHFPKPIDPARLLAALGRSIPRGEMDAPPRGNVGG